MNNSERFYYETDFGIKLLYCFLKADSQNHNYQARKMIENIEACKIDIDSMRFSFETLVALTSLALNKEKIEQQAHIDWNNYKAEMVSTFENFSKRYSKIPYFKEWLQVSDCATKYVNENAQFWIKKVRNAFLHGQFEIDYDNLKKYTVKICQSTPTKIDAKINIFEPGLTEFVEDNFRNIYNQGYGIKDSYNFMRYPDFDITNEKTLEEYVSKISMNQYKIDFDKYTYDGMTLNSADGKKIKPKIETSQIVEDSNPNVNMPEFLVANGGSMSLSPEKAKLLAKLIHKNAGYIYHSNKKRLIVHKYFSNYTFTYETMNSILHELVNAFNYVYFTSLPNHKKQHNFNRTFQILDFCKDNLKPTMTLLQLYRLQYRLQCKNFPPVDFSNLNCERLFGSTTPELIDARIEKIMKNNPDLTKKQATNKAYLEILRDSLAHGNVEYQRLVSDDLDIIEGRFTFTDSWTDKAGNHTETKIISNVGSLEYLFTEIDKDLDFLPYKDMEDEI